MSAFASSTFKASSYLLARPTYPASLYSYIADYSRTHAKNSSGLDYAVDVGCGPGEATVPLTELYKKTIGVDASAVMIGTAISKYRAQVDQGSLKFIVGSGNTLAKSLENANFGSLKEKVSLVTVAQAFHWFDHPKFFKDAHELLAPGGTLAFWGYVDSIFVDHPDASELLLDYCYNDKHMGPYWELPGRNILREKYAGITVPSDLFTNVERHLDPDFFVIKKTLTVAAMHAYLKTFSAYHNWQKANADKPDIADECIAALKKLKGWSNDTEVLVKWETVAVLASKK